ncbi:AMP-binding protein [Micromonospora harpali]|uniref:AMP-binding protein n=1 Tax=Micromonospora TaxID=1873 RepID=UPI00338E2001
MAAQFLRVVVNRAGRYALWPHAHPTPAGWADTHFIGSRLRCLAQIGELSRTRGVPATGPPAHPPAHLQVRLAAGASGRVAVADPTVQTLPGLLATVVAATPDAPAVVHEGHPTSFRDLDRRSGDLARLLAEHGVRPGDTVGLLLRGGVDAVVGRLAALKSGAAYLPLPSGDGRGAARGGLGLVLAEPEWAGSARRHGVRVLPWRRRHGSGRALVRPVRADDPAYVLSGVTPLGGLLLAHRHLVLAARSGATGGDPADAAPVPPGAVEAAVWGPLLRGDPLALGPEGAAAPPAGALPGGDWQVLDDGLVPAAAGRLYVGAPWLAGVVADSPLRSAGWLVPDPSDPGGNSVLVATAWRAARAPDGRLRLLGPAA